MYITNLKIKMLKLKLKMLNKKIERNKKRIIRKLQKSHMDVKNAIIHHLYNDEILGYGSLLHRVDQKTGECVDYLMYFPDFDPIHKTRYYLDAYLTTNREVLDEKQIGELEGLLRYFN